MTKIARDLVDLRFIPSINHVFDRKLDLIVDSQERTRSTLEHLHNAEERRQADEEERKRCQAIQRVLG